MAGKLDRLSLERVLSEVRREKGIDKAIIIEALEAALLTAARKKYGPRMELEAHFNPELGELELFSFRTVVEKARDEYNEISFVEAQILILSLEQLLVNYRCTNDHKDGDGELQHYQDSPD